MPVVEYFHQVNQGLILKPINLLGLVAKKKSYCLLRMLGLTNFKSHTQHQKRCSKNQGKSIMDKTSPNTLKIMWKDKVLLHILLLYSYLPFLPVLQ